MSVRARVEKYRRFGGAADLVRVEVLVPPSARNEVLRVAERLRARHRDDKDLQALCDDALSRYGARIEDNLDLGRLPDNRARAFVIAKAMMDRGDTLAFVLARRILALLEAG